MKNLIYIFIILVSFSCETKRHKDAGSADLKEEMKMRKLTRLKDGDIGQYVIDLGNKLLLVKGKEKETDDFYKKYQVRLYFLRLGEESEDNILNQIREAYEYQFEQKHPLTNNLQHKDGTWLFTSPQINKEENVPSLEGIWYFKVSTRKVILMQK